MLYRITFDDEDDYVEAGSYGEAIVLWRKNLIAENQPGDFEEDVEPEGCERVTTKPVIR